ncbi:MAG TPA: serine hydrolase domain-containing protein [Candidatus Baltobacteraceae bacterium]|nr:serine hydrolase domain-containing protein [Candidatus Baltobacteraceae bacterium]
MTNRSWIALLVVAIVLPGIAPVPPPSFIKRPIETRIYPGISVAVGSVAKGLIFAQAYGDANVAAGTPMTPDTPLHVASVSKSITATAVMQLVQSGRVSLDKPVSIYVPNFTNGAKITVRQLLDHSSGIPGHAHNDPIIHGDDAISEAEFFRKLNATPLFAAPGTKWEYANENFYLAATIVQNVTHQSFASYLQKHVFGPAHMTHSYSSDGRKDASVALGYVHRTPSDPFLQCPAPDWSNVLGGGGIISTPSDIVRFDIALYDGTLLDKTHLAEMTSAAFPIAGTVSYALGWFVQPGVLLWHEGDFTTATAINAVFPDGTFVAEVTNGAELGPDFDRFYFARQLQNAYGATPVAMGTPHPASMLEKIGPFNSCEQIFQMLFAE